MTAAASASASPVARPDAPRAPDLTMEVLASMNTNALGDLYRRATLPALSLLDGTPRGRMLSVVGVERSPLSGALRQFAASPRFPWAGKSFSTSDEETGQGINRVRLAGSRHQWFRFETRIEPSAIDAEPCVFLDYDLPENPWFIRRIRDELRQVSSHLFLGPAMWKTDSHPRLVLFFAIDASTAHQPSPRPWAKPPASRRGDRLMPS